MLHTFLSTYSKNQIQILQHIRRRGRITRSELVEVSGFKLLTVTKTVARFLDDGLIVEAGYEDSTGGRKATLLSINPHFRYTLAVDMGASGARIGVVGMDGTVIEDELVKKEYRMPAHHLSVEELREKLALLLEKYGRERILGLGIGISGTVRHSEGRILFCPNLSGWNDVDVAEEFGNPLGIPVLVDTVARCMALAEFTLGAGKDTPNQVTVSVGTSVSAGIIMDGRIYRGGDEAAGEIGHTTVRENGGLCTCGNIGCLENYVNQHLIVRQVNRRLQDVKGYSPLRALVQEGEKPTPEQIRQAAEEGDLQVLEVLADCADTMGTAISYLANIVNPQVIILGGRAIEHYPMLVDEVKRVVKRRSAMVTQRNLAIRASGLQERSTLIGSALQVIDALFA